MARVHLLNVSPGDCTIIEHNSGRRTMIDICGGNLKVRQLAVEAETLWLVQESRKRVVNHRMCERPTNPINYMKTNGLGTIWRFILSHPDMDHMDGLDELVREIGVFNFWDTGARRNMKTDNFFRYNEEDWNTYEKIVADMYPRVRTGIRQAGDKFSFANMLKDGEKGGDGLHICAPGKELLDDPNVDDDVNEASYIVSYRSAGGKLVFPGDAHDESWSYAIEHHHSSVENCAFLLAPHHGRDSGRSYDFLDVLQPKMTWLGCSPSKHIDYRQWDRRGLERLTSNQTGNVVLEIGDSFYDIWIENEDFAREAGSPNRGKSKEGHVYYKTVEE